LGDGVVLAGFGFELGVVLKAAIGADVSDGDFAFGEDARDEKIAVADKGVFFAAHHGDAEFAAPFIEAGDAGIKEFGGGEAVVENAAIVVVEVIAFGAASEFAAHEDVFDAVFFGERFEFGHVELGRVAGVGLRADVNKGLDAELFEEADKKIGRMVGMTDGEERLLRDVGKGGHERRMILERCGEESQSKEGERGEFAGLALRRGVV
jgi:hypothetical protein